MRGCRPAPLGNHELSSADHGMHPDGYTPAECARIMADHGAIAVGANCEQEPSRMLPPAPEMRASLPVPIRRPTRGLPHHGHCHCFTRQLAFS